MNTAIRTILRVLLVTAFLFAASRSCLAQSSLEAPAVSARADAWLKAYEAAKDFSGVALIAQDDKILFEKAYGLADPQVGTPNRLDTRFRIASVSKTFTAAGIEKLAAEGRLHYSDRLSTYVAGIPNGDAITIEQLLLHESGVGVLDTEDVYRNCLTRQDILERLAKTRPLFSPGAKSEYSNEGYFLLAAVVERIAGTSLEEFLGTNLFASLQMANSGVACRDLPGSNDAYGSVATASRERLRGLPFNEAALDGAGSVYSNAEDLYRWLRAVNTANDGGKGDRPQFGVGQLKYPFGWGRRKYSSRDLIEQSGQLEGFFSHVAIYPKEHIYAIILSNIQSGLSNRVALDLEAVLFGGTISQPPVINPVVLGMRSMRQYIGSYRSAEIPYPQALEVRDGQLQMHWGSDPFWRDLVMIDGDTFFERAEYARIHFERGADGLVHGMTWTWPGGTKISFTKDQVTGGPEPSPPPNT